MVVVLNDDDRSRSLLVFENVVGILPVEKNVVEWVDC